MASTGKTTSRVRGSWPEIEQAARRSRWEPTRAEATLWSALQGKQVAGLRFRRQHPVGPFILDFYCSARKLVVELDGEVHEEAEQTDRDETRTAQLEAFGYRVLRFRNAEVLADLSSVLERIQRAAAIE